MDGKLQCSVVMSAYNAEKTIEKSIGSLLSQTYPHIEVIVVDDCSTDKTVEIVKAIAKQDNRVKLICHDVNMGAGLTRRDAIANISGEYMTFCDCDDYLKPDCIETLYKAMQENDVDIVAPGLIITDDKGNVLLEKIPDRCIQSGGAKYKKNPQDTKRFMNPMLIKSSIWDNVTYSHRRFIEDTQTLIQVLYYAKNIMLLNYAGYYYVQYPTSLCHTTNGVKKLIASALCAKDIMEFFKGKNDRLASPKGFLMLCDQIFKELTDEDRELYKQDLFEIVECKKEIENSNKIWL